MLLNNVWQQFLLALALTIIIEISLSQILGVRNKKDIINIILVNLITNPIVNVTIFILNILYGLKYFYVGLIITELITVLFEGYVYKKCLSYKKINCYLLSIILNATSFMLGFLIK